ncbi:hypothetical protein BCY91_11125 [Pelobium manganitolerans]|uniref:Uncharacterized protein n=1 Tax=Pelobium manganitolerans TaxID=1842495 RepID=A0A419S255_9SPHI|nr:hypothetical protein [Pelobium manganitolerans]RKD12794.1 hypothetical protein BCY91_11125 [Pelobium manganitolerans]
MIKKALLAFYICLIVNTVCAQTTTSQVIICSDGKNDIVNILRSNNYSFQNIERQIDAVNAAKIGGAVIFVANQYPQKRFSYTPGVAKIIKEKQLKVFVEYPDVQTGLAVSKDTVQTQLERGVVITNIIPGVDSLDLFAVHNAYFVKSKAKNPLIIVAKVAGFDDAQYGVSDVRHDPLLFKEGNALVATTRLSNLLTSRFGPVDHLKPVWEYIFSYLHPKTQWSFKVWPLPVSPVFAKNYTVTAKDHQEAIKRGNEWFYKGRFFVHPSWEAQFLKRQGDGLNPAGPPLSQSVPVGDGSLGVLEGHLSRIQIDGSQIYRYWMRADCNAEVAYSLTSAKNASERDKTVAKNLLNYVFKTSILRGDNRNNPQSPAYGLVGWSMTHPYIYYGDDNARVILGALGASARLNDSQWDKYIAEAIIANFRTTGKNGFRGERLEDVDIVKKGLKALQNRDLIYPHPHFESWMWACYLWLYDKTGYKPFLEQAKKAIAITMGKYPDWKWTNGIQQERARMILPLAWLVRVEDTPKHREWLSLIADKVLENMDESGAIREELGSSSEGMFGATKTNADYGKTEAPLIAVNGDPVADMLYTTNFGFFALNEAARATGEDKYKVAVDKIADFLVKIQVKSKTHKDLDGAWFRAFDYNRWEYWASNADAGWGAWGTLTGWTQSWIVSTLALHQENSSLWDISKTSNIKNEAQQVIALMIAD